MLPHLNKSAKCLPILVMLITGCRGNGEERVGLGRSRDPLLGERIPRQNLPVPGRDSYGQINSDPLLNPPSKVASVNRDPFRLGKNTTAAALSMRGTDESDVLAIKDLPPDNNLPTITPTSATSPSTNSEINDYIGKLRAVGGKPFAPTKLSNDTYEFRCAVPISTSGAMRQYTGVGDSPLAAVQDVYVQVREDLSR